MKKSTMRLISLSILVLMVGIGLYWMRANEPNDKLRDVQHKPNTQTNLAAVKSASSDIVIDSRKMIDGIKQRKKQAWRDAENAPHLDESILSLLRDSDRESAIFALNLKLICLSVASKAEKNPEFGASFLDFLFGPYSGQSKENAAKAFKLNEAYLARCGKAGDSMFAMSEVRDGIRKSRLQGSALALAPNSLKELEAGLTAQSYDALDRTLKDRDLAPIWLAKNFWEFRQVPASRAFLDDLTSEAQQAVGWLAICNLGGGCEEGGLTRLNACMTSQLCAGASVEESVAHVLGANNMPLITARANQLGFSILANGAVFFMPKRN